MRRGGQVKAGLAALLCALCVLALSAGQASAERTHNSQVGEGFNGANTVVFEANDDLWVSDGGHFLPNQVGRGQNGLYKIDALPSQTLLEAPNTFAAWEFASLAITVAVDQETGEVFASQSNGRAVDIFVDGVFSHAWTGINGVSACCPGDVHMAIDNSNGFSRGRVYLSLAAPENDVEALDNGERPVDFPATADYIKGNRLTGTPGGHFGQVEQVSVDASGNLYVADGGKAVIDEFDSSGTFLRTFPDPGGGGAGIDPTNGDVLITGGSVSEYDANGNFLGTVPDSSGSGGTPGVNSNGYLYTPIGYGSVDIFNPAPATAKVSYDPVINPTTTAGTLNASVDPNGGGNVTECHFEYGPTTAYGGGVLPCLAAPPYSGVESVHAEVSGLSTGTAYHYRAVVKDADGSTYGEDQVYIPGHVLGLSTDAATGLGESNATLNGSFVGNGEDTHYYFEWGPTESYGNTTATPPGADTGSPSGPSRSSVTSEVTGLGTYSTYHYRVVAANAGGTSYGADRTLTTIPGLPTGRNPYVTAVHSDRAVMHGEIDPHGGNTIAQFEFVPDAAFQESGWAEAESAPIPAIQVGMGKEYQSLTTFVSGLEQGTLYHYRVQGTNGTGSGGAEATFATFPFIPSTNDACPNAHVRQQTGGSLLLDCRGYELVSAGNSGGYDVESSLVVGQTPFGGYPDAHQAPQEAGEEPQPRVLYGVHDGGIPGTGNPTNRGVDPYVATRGPDGWTTRYVGIPANDPSAAAPFSSTLAEANASLETLAFGGSEICSPCFADGTTGSPIHLPDGQLVQGMAGSTEPGPSAQSAGFIGRHLSADGSHFVFGSTSKFEPDGGEGAISIYDRNLNTAQTHVVSKLPAGGNIPCLLSCSTDGIGELDISSDGSRVIVGQLVSEEGGERHWHLYADIGDSGSSVDLTPGTTTGAQYDGMTADGSKVFLTTADQLLPADTDHSADAYEAEIDAGGNVSLRLISTGSEGTGNSDSCHPSANTTHAHWNTNGAQEDCGVVAVGGGGGVASRDGTFYFLSPELLDGSGTGVQNAPNLYVARPGQAPHFVTTLESSSNAPLPPPAHPFLRSFGSFGHVAGVAIDHATGDIYALDIRTDEGTGYVYKFDPAGHAVLNFGISGKLTVGGMLGFYNLPAGIAVDNDPGSPNYGDLYVPDILDENVGVYNSTGAHEATIPAPSPTGVGVDPTNGELYVASFGGTIYRFDTGGKPVSSFEASASGGATGVAIDTSHKVYVVNGGGFGAKGTTEVYTSSGTHLGQLDANPSYAVSVDVGDNHVYVDEGNQVTEFNSAGNTVGVPTGAGHLTGSFGVGADSGNVAAGSPGNANVALFGPPFIPPDPLVDNPVVVDSVTSPGTRYTGDFQVTPSGNDAAFTTTLSLTGYVNAGHREVFRYSAAAEQLECASCNPTSEEATGDATLAGDGLSLTEDGRVFFNSTEGLVDRDLNEKEDAYEWEPGGFQTVLMSEPVAGTKCETAAGCVELISTGTSLLGSRLLGATTDGTDAFFFSRDSLVDSDHNGNRVKIYDARVVGGLAQVPPPVPCKASDECHGPGSQAPPSPEIKSLAPTPGGNFTPGRRQGCKKGSVKKHGKCVRKSKRQSHAHRKAKQHG